MKTAAVITCAASATLLAFAPAARQSGLVPSTVGNAIESVAVAVCPANTTKGWCLEHGKDDADCCAMAGAAGCWDGTPAIKGAKCHENGAVTTCCPARGPECPANTTRIGCVADKRLDTDCCAPPEQAGCFHGKRQKITGATAGEVCSPDGQRNTCCPTPKPDLEALDSLFCFYVSNNDGGEAALTRAHFQDKRSIFQCEAWAVLSNGPMHPVPVIDIGPLNSGWGFWHSWVNTGVFIRAWDAVINEGKWLNYAWTVKVDPDTVWHPQKLKWHIKSLNVKWSDNVYIRNAGPTMFGGIEVVALESMLRLFHNRKKVCTFNLNGSPEDVWMGQCLNALGCWQKQDDALLKNFLDGLGACNDKWAVAFHPFKWVDGWRACHDMSAR